MRARWWCYTNLSLNCMVRRYARVVLKTHGYFRCYTMGTQTPDSGWSLRAPHENNWTSWHRGHSHRPCTKLGYNPLNSVIINVSETRRHDISLWSWPICLMPPPHTLSSHCWCTVIRLAKTFSSWKISDIVCIRIYIIQLNTYSTGHHCGIAVIGEYIGLRHISQPAKRTSAIQRGWAKCMLDRVHCKPQQDQDGDHENCTTNIRAATGLKRIASP
jgi:hypothetical protein